MEQNTKAVMRTNKKLIYMQQKRVCVLAKIYLMGSHILNGHFLCMSSFVYLLRPTKQQGRFVLWLFLVAKLHFVASQAPLHNATGSHH